MEAYRIFYQPWILFIWGACWGSFLNVVLYRYPLGRSVVSPASACPSCGKAIAFYDNIPVLSWFILRGRCRRCKTGFSPMYAVNEAFFGLLTALAVVLHPRDPLAGFSLGMTVLVVVPMVRLLILYKRAPWYLVTAALTFGALYGAAYLVF